jgi:hypothetical protein
VTEEEASDAIEPDCDLVVKQALAKGAGSTVYTRLVVDPPDEEPPPSDLGDWSGVLDIPNEELNRFIAEHAGTFLDPGGDFDGARLPVQRAMAIGLRNGLKILSEKREAVTKPSDHDRDQMNAYAADLSNYPQPSAEMDRAATQIALAMGVDDWSGGEGLVRTTDLVRAQLLWRVPGHENHIHFSCQAIQT